MQPLHDRFLRGLSSLVGKDCWGVAAGGNTGSVVDLHFGMKVKRRDVLRNMALDPNLRTHRGESGLFVECCWRLEGPQGIAVGWRDSLAEPATRDVLTELLEGGRVLSVAVHGPILDVDIVFDRGATLRLFCDQSAEDEDNYTLFVGRAAYVVGPGGVALRRESADG